jgi:16S rRNA (uracil1498-N3)-methyltransferase
MNVFYLPEISGITAELNQEESGHCIRVLRLHKGDKVHVMNGKGLIFEAIISVPDPKLCKIEIIKELSSRIRRPYQLSIAIAPTKNIDRFEWFLEKSTEIGIDRIIPVICQHSERKEIKNERLEKLLISAMKQSGQPLLPELSMPVSFKALVNKYFDGDKFIAHCEATDKKELKNEITPGKNVMILIGPEGDFDTSEIILAVENGFRPVSLGDSRLRTETAGIVACHTVCLVNQK